MAEVSPEIRGTWLENLPEEVRPTIAPPWSAVKDQLQAEYPQEDPEQMRRVYEQKRMAHAAQQVARAEIHGENAIEYFARRSLPFGATAGNLRLDYDYNEAQKKIAAGTAGPDEHWAVAQYERKKELEAEKGFLGKAGSALAGVPALVGEAMVGGSALRGIGLVPHAAKAAAASARVVAGEVGVQVPKLLSVRGLTGALGYNAAQTALMPSLYMERASQNNMRQGRDPLDPRGFPAALGLGMVQNAILGQVAGKLPPAGQGPARYLGHLGARAAVGVGEQAGADFLTSTVGKLIPALSDLNTDYGTVGQFYRGERGEALQNAAVQFLTFGAFGVLHGSPREGSQNALSQAFRRSFAASAKAGLPPEAAAFEASRAFDTVADALNEKAPAPMIREVDSMAHHQADRVKTLIDAMPDGPSKDLTREVLNTVRSAERQEHYRGGMHEPIFEEMPPEKRLPPEPANLPEQSAPMHQEVLPPERGPGPGEPPAPPPPAPPPPAPPTTNVLGSNVSERVPQTTNVLGTRLNTEPVEAGPRLDPLAGLTPEQMKTLARKAGLKTSGKIDNLKERLRQSPEALRLLETQAPPAAPPPAEPSLAREVVAGIVNPATLPGEAAAPAAMATVANAPPAPAAAESVAAAPPPFSLAGLSFKELQTLAKEAGLKKSGLKREALEEAIRADDRARELARQKLGVKPDEGVLPDRESAQALEMHARDPFSKEAMDRAGLSSYQQNLILDYLEKDGLSGVAQQYGIGESTVRNHLKEALVKLGADWASLEQIKERNKAPLAGMRRSQASATAGEGLRVAEGESLRSPEDVAQDKALLEAEELHGMEQELRDRQVNPLGIKRKITQVQDAAELNRLWGGDSLVDRYARKLWNFLSNEGGWLDLDVLKEYGQATWGKIKLAARHVRDNWKELAGAANPRTMRLSEPTGNAVSRLDGSKVYGRFAGELYARQILGPQVTPEQRRLWGSTLFEERLRSARTGRSSIGEDWSALPDEATYQQVLASPEYQQVMQRYRDSGFVEEIEAMYRKAEGMEDTDPIGSATQLADRPFTARRLSDLERPVTPGAGNLKNTQINKLGAAKKATLAGEGYDTDLQSMIEHTFASRAHTAAKAEAFRIGAAERVLVWGRPGQEILIDGEKTREIPKVQPPRGTQTAETGETSAYVRESVYPEWRQSLEVDQPLKFETVSAAMTLLNKGALASTAEFIYHTKNQATMLFKPGLGVFGIKDLISNLYKTINKSPEIKDRLRELARIGAAKPPGAEVGQILPESLKHYDPTYWSGWLLHQMDHLMRLGADDAFERLKRQGRIAGTEQQKRDFVNQLGLYLRGAENKAVVFLKDTGIGPFATAATNYAAQGLRTLGGFAPGVKGKTLGHEIGLRAEFAANVLAMAAAAGLANYLAWGKIDGDDATPLGAVKLGEKGGKTVSFDLVNLTGLTRGMRLAGALALAEGSREGKPAGKILDKGVEDLLHGLVHPAVGPSVSFAWTAATGQNTLGRQVAEPAPVGGSQAWQNLVAGLKTANPTVSTLGGFDRPRDTESTFGDRAARLAGPYGAREKLDPAVSAYYDRLKDLEDHRRSDPNVKAGRPFPQEVEYRQLHAFRSALDQISQALRGEVRVGGQVRQGPQPDLQRQAQLRAIQAQLARRALEATRAPSQAGPAQ